MIPNKLMTILIAGTLVGASGCSGTRLRNLVTRSDYMSLEELESQDAAAETAVAESEESDSIEKLVSSELESSEDDETAGDEKKKSWFSFASLLGRSSDDSEVGPDPFVDVEEAEIEKSALVEAEGDIESAATESPAEKTTEKYSATMTNIENQAEGMFDKLAAAEAETAVEERVKLPEIMPASGISTSGEQSFVDFIANRDGKDAESDANEVPIELVRVVAEAEQSNPFAAEAAVAATTTADEISDFDRLLGRSSNTTDAGERPARDAFSSELFPELDQLIADGNAGQSANQQDREQATLPESELRNPPQTHFESHDAAVDPFQLAASKHGFNEVQQEDPWAAFTRQDGKNSQDISDVVLQESAEPDEFVWGSQSQTPQPETLKTLTVNGSVRNDDDTVPSQPVFQQVSSSDRPSRVAGGAQLSTDFSAGLTIPTPPMPQTPPSSDFGQFAATPTEQVSREEAPQAFSDPADTAFEDAFDATLIGAGPEARTGSSVTTASGWPMRTWIFLIGFAVVAYLLFAPARQNRPRA